MSLRQRFFKSGIKKGFTLIELLVSIGVMAIILGISLSGGPQSIARISLAQDIYQVELLLREAQLQGSSINSLNNTFGGAGLFFQRTNATTTIKFKDRAIVDPNRAISIGNGLYDMTPLNERESFLTTTNRNVIGKLCVATTAPSIFFCNTENNPAITNLTVSFNRPKQTAHIYINNATTTDFAAACIQFDSFRSPAQGYVKSLLVYKSGMITKRSGTCN